MTLMQDPLNHPWKAMVPREVQRLFESAPFSWWIAGGYAIELALNRPLREHDDIDVLILRRDHLALRNYIASWDCWAADPPGHLRPWSVGEMLPESVHDIWCRMTPEQPWSLQVMLDKGDETMWWSRRDERFQMPLTTLGRVSVEGIPYLTPIVQLHYKARLRRPKDEIDFAAALDTFDAQDCERLATAIKTSYGTNHPWLDRLQPERAASDQNT